MSKKKYNKIEIPKPLALVNYIGKRFPRVWETYDAVRKLISMDDSYPSTYPSRKVCGAIARDNIKQNTPGVVGNQSVDAHIVYVLGAWREYKEVYSIDKDLASILMSMADDIKIPVDILRNVPFPSFYIEVADSDAYRENGFFITIDDKANEIDFFSITDDGYAVAMPIPLDNNITIEESISKTVSGGNPYYDMNQHKDNIEFVKKAIQLVLYICAINADIVENPQQKAIMRKPSSTSKPKDVLREVRKWDVGYKVGRTIRLAMQTETTDKSVTNRTHKTRSPKRPHARRGHFHHFWVGSKASEERKLVLKWVAPMFINTKIDGEMPANITKIEI